MVWNILLIGLDSQISSIWATEKKIPNSLKF